MATFYSNQLLIIVVLLAMVYQSSSKNSNDASRITMNNVARRTRNFTQILVRTYFKIDVKQVRAFHSFTK